MIEIVLNKACKSKCQDDQRVMTTKMRRTGRRGRVQLKEEVVVILGGKQVKDTF